jgi:hypothetical protein
MNGKCASNTLIEQSGTTNETAAEDDAPIANVVVDDDNDKDDTSET